MRPTSTAIGYPDPLGMLDIGGSALSPVRLREGRVRTLRIFMTQALMLVGLAYPRRTDPRIARARLARLPHFLTETAAKCFRESIS